MVRQPVADFLAILDEPQILDVGRFVCHTRLLPHLADSFATTGEVLRIEEAGAEGFHRDAASRGAEFVDALEQQVLAIGGQVGQ